MMKADVRILPTMNPILFRPVRFASAFLAFVILHSAFVISPASADIDRTKPPAPGPAPAASFPAYETRILSNGLRVYVVEDHRTPTVTLRLLVKSGDAADRNEVGVADATAALLNRGTAKRTAIEFAELSDFLGARIEGASAADDTSLIASGLVKDLPKLVDLLSDAALHPTFPEDELAKHKRQMISAIVQGKQRPATLAENLVGKLLYGSAHPYGNYLTEENVNAITHDMLVRFHALHFSPDNTTLAVVGDLKADDVMPVIEKAFGEWKVAPGEDASEPIFPDLPALPKALTVHLVDRPGSVQSAIVVCRRGVTRDNHDTPELGVLNSILGGGFSGRLFQNLREKHGYTYGSSSSFSMNRVAGTFQASAEVRNAVTLPAIQEILNELRRLDAENVPDLELGMQREFLAGNYLLSLENAGRTASRVQEIDLYKLPADYYKTYASRVSSVGANQIKSLADKYLGNPDKGGWTVVVVGEAKEVKAQLETLGTVIVYDTDLKVKKE